MLTVVLFDLDGTLIDTTNLILESYRHTVRKHLGYTPRDEQILPGFGAPSHLNMRRFATEGVDEMMETFRSFGIAMHDELIQPVPDVPEVLEVLRQRGYRIGVVTSKRRDLAQMGLARYRLEGFMQVMVTVEDTAVHKPYPAPIHRALELLAARPEEAMYVGDSDHDVMAARAAGVVAAAALWGPAPRQVLVDAQPDHLLSSMRDLLDHCPPLNGRGDGRRELEG